jgi:hypothetical protein
MLSAILISCLVYVVRHFAEYDQPKKKYIFLVLMVYLISTMVFIVLYTKGTPIDINPRHLKFSSFLLYPLLIGVSLKKFKKSWVLGFIALLFVYAIGNHIRLTRAWTKTTAVTKSGFRLFKEDLPLNLKNGLDSLVKTKTIVISGYEDRYAIDNQLILPVMSSEDLRPYLRQYGYPMIFVDSVALPNTSLH